MSFTQDEIKQKIIQLFPEGPAWNFDKDSDYDNLADALAYEVTLVSTEIERLIREANPLYMDTFLQGREEEANTKDSCQVAATVKERLDRVIYKWRNTGGQSIQFLINAAADIGYTITITETNPFTPGSLVGDLLTNGDDWAHTFYVNGALYVVKPFIVGTSAVGEALAIWGNEELECLINNIKPAHTTVLYSYT